MNIITFNYEATLQSENKQTRIVFYYRDKGGILVPGSASAM